MTISENDTRAYHRGDRASLGWEQTISESLRDPASAYTEALEVKRAYGDVVGDLLESRGMIRNGFRVLEVGGGHGNLARILLSRFSEITMTMVDISPIFCAHQRRTLAPFGDRAAVVEADVFQYLGRSDPFDLIISNENMGDFPALVDIPRELLLDYLERPTASEAPKTRQAAYLDEARRFILELGIDVADAPDIINLNTGAVRFVRMAMEKTDRLFVVEHSSDWSLPEFMVDVLRDSRADSWPKKIILFSHDEVTICFDHLGRLLSNEGIAWEGGRLMDLLRVRNDPEIRYILLSGSIQTPSHEIIGEFIDHVKEYQWLLAHR
jgi:protein-L-isoaspartate O-methyltransferase